MEEHQTNGNFEKIHGENLRKNPFKVPEGYFETLPEQIVKRIENERPKPKTFQLREFLVHSAWAIAASVTLLIGISMFYWFQKDKSNAQVAALPEITADEIIASEVLQESYLTDPLLEDAAIEYDQTIDTAQTGLVSELSGDTDKDLILDYLKEEDLSNEELAMLFTEN